MPYKIRKVRYRDCYSVKSKTRTFAKCSDKEEAKRQLKFLRALKWNKQFRPTRNKTVKEKTKKKTMKLRRSERLKKMRRTARRQRR